MPAAIPLARKAVTFNFCQTARSARTAIAIFVSKRMYLSVARRPHRRLERWCADHVIRRGSGPGPSPGYSSPAKQTKEQVSIRQAGRPCLGLLGMRSERLKGHLDLLLLSVLSRGPGHGYEVITRLRDRSDRAFELPEGTVYPALHRLEEAGLLASAWDTVSGRRRRIYRLTLAGEAALAEQSQQWSEFSGSVARVLGTQAAVSPRRPALTGVTA